MVIVYVNLYVDGWRMARGGAGMGYPAGQLSGPMLTDGTAMLEQATLRKSTLTARSLATRQARRRMKALSSGEA